MRDPFGSIQNMVSGFRGFMQNPMQYMLSRRLNLPQGFNGDANQAIQYLMSSGQLTQEQYNWAKKTAKQIERNPQFQNLMNAK